MDDRFEGRVLQETANRISTGLRHGLFAVTLALLSVTYLRLLDAHPLAWIGLAWFGLTFSLIPVLRHFARKPHRSLVDLLVDSDGVQVNGKPILRRRDIRSAGMLAANDDRFRVVIRGHRPLTSFGQVLVLAFVADGAQARTMVAASGLSAERQVFRSTSLRPQAAWQVVLSLVVYVSLCALFFPLGLKLGIGLNPIVVLPTLVAGALAFLVYALLAHTTVTVGNDGVEVRRPLRTRFFPLHEIRDVQTTQKALLLSLTNGQHIPLIRNVPIEPVGQFGVTDVGLARGLLGDRILEAVRAYRASRPEAAAAALQRNNRSTDEWLASLRAIGLGATDYRARVVAAEELQRLVADAAAAADVRVGAAVALRVAEGAVGTARVRIAGESTALPELREALKHIAEESDEGNLQRYLARF